MEYVTPCVHIASGEQLVTSSGEITVTLKYPLKKPYVVHTYKKDGWVLSDFVLAILDGYEKAYSEPEKYEPWGHSIGELYLEGYEEVSPGVFEIYVGS